MNGPEEAVAKEKGDSHWEGIVIVKDQIGSESNGAVHDSLVCVCVQSWKLKRRGEWGGEWRFLRERFPGGVAPCKVYA